MSDWLSTATEPVDAVTPKQRGGPGRTPLDLTDFLKGIDMIPVGKSRTFTVDTGQPRMRKVARRDLQGNIVRDSKGNTMWEVEDYTETGDPIYRMESTGRGIAEFAKERGFYLAARERNLSVKVGYEHIDNGKTKLTVTVLEKRAVSPESYLKRAVSTADSRRKAQGVKWRSETDPQAKKLAEVKGRHFATVKEIAIEGLNAIKAGEDGEDYVERLRKMRVPQEV